MIKRFISYYKPHKILFFADLFAALLLACCNLFYPTIVKNIINIYIHDETAKRIIIWSGILLLIYLVKMGCNYFVGYYGHLVGTRMQLQMRADLFRKYESLPFSFYDTHKTGDLIARLTGDLFDVSEFAHHGPENLFLAVVMFVGAFALLFSINVTLSLILLAVLPLIVLCTLSARKSMRKAMHGSRVQNAAINVRLENSVTGIRETKSYVAEDGEIRKFDKENGMYAHFRELAVKALGSYEAVMGFLTDLLYLSVVFAGGLFLYYGKIDAGEFAAFILYISMFITPIQRFVSFFEIYQEGMSGFRRFHEIMKIPEESDTGSVELTDIAGNLQFDRVSFAYGGEDGTEAGDNVITDFSLSVPAGTTLALVGPSGGGKSTLCNLIPRFYNIKDGAIRLDGTDLRDVTLSSLRKNIGIVSQTVFLFDGTVRDNIAYGSPEATDEEVIAAAKKANIHDDIVRLDKGYDSAVGERGVRFSGGQRQRIAIARVFLKNPKLLILDEATSALDNVTEMQIQHSLEELSRGRTVIVVAHRLSTVKNADTIAVIDKTGIVEIGSHEELLRKDGAYRKLYSYQFREEPVPVS